MLTTVKPDMRLGNHQENRKHLIRQLADAGLRRAKSIDLEKPVEEEGLVPPGKGEPD